MRKIAIIGLSGLFMLSIVFTGCDSVKNANNTQKGAGIGAVAGGVIGAVLGNNLGKGGNAALGAAIGAAVGGGTGALIGNKMDKQAREIDQALPGADVERVGEGIHLVLNENVPFELVFPKIFLSQLIVALAIGVLSPAAKTVILDCAKP